jgi:hypothetical protein
MIAAYCAAVTGCTDSRLHVNSIILPSDFSARSSPIATRRGSVATYSTRTQSQSGRSRVERSS